MLASLLTQLLGKVAEAKLMHAKACNLPMCTCCSQLCRCCMCFVVALAASHVFWFSCVVSIGVGIDTFEARCVAAVCMSRMAWWHHLITPHCSVFRPSGMAWPWSQTQTLKRGISESDRQVSHQMLILQSGAQSVASLWFPLVCHWHQLIRSHRRTPSICKDGGISKENPRRTSGMLPVKEIRNTVAFYWDASYLAPLATE